MAACSMTEHELAPNFTRRLEVITSSTACPLATCTFDSWPSGNFSVSICMQMERIFSGNIPTHA